MDSDSITTIIIMVVLIGLSGYFSATETAFSAINKTKVRNMAEKGDKKAKRVLDLSDRFDQLLSTILVGNNIVNIGLASISTVFFIKHFGDMGASLSTIVITIAVLIFGEVTPKSLAKEMPERFAMFSSPLIRALMLVLRPINFLFSLWKKLLARLFNISDDRKMTQDELLTLVKEVEDEGGINEQESQLLKSAIEFTDQEAEDILTPRVDVEGVPVDATREEIAAVFTESGYTRLPVYEETIDNIVGILHQKDFYEGTHVTDRPIRSLMKKPIFITPSMKISDLLRQLQKSKSHIVVVSDEYGGTMGIVTMEDILEELVGDIWDEHDEIIEDITKIEGQTYRVLGSADWDKLAEFFALEEDGEDEDYTSVSGWVMEQLGRIPDEGDTFTFEKLSVTVTKTDYQRVQEIMVTVKPESEKKETDNAES